MTRARKPDPGWVSVYSTPWEAEAEIVRARLESEDLPALLSTAAGGIGIAGGLLTGGVGLVRFDVVVPEGHAAKAREILSSSAAEERCSDS